MINDNREYRRAGDVAPIEEEEQYIVEGYATTFNDPYVLYDDGKDKVYEEVDARAFDNADMSDVIMQYDHTGRVYARQKNGTLQLTCDEHGLKIRADLSKTAGSRQLYEDIKTGMVSEMSFAFTVDQDEFDKTKHLRSIKSIRKVFDVSAVSIPANPNTEISARNYFNGVIEAERAERLEAEKREEQIRRIKLNLEVSK